MVMAFKLWFAHRWQLANPFDTVILIRFGCDCWRRITNSKRLNFRYDFFASLQSKFLQIIFTIKHRWLSPIVTFKVHSANWKQLDQKSNKFQSRLSRTINPKNYHLHWIEHQTNGCLILIAIEWERKRDEFFWIFSKCHNCLSINDSIGRYYYSQSRYLRFQFKFHMIYVSMVDQ